MICWRRCRLGSYGGEDSPLDISRVRWFACHSIYPVYLRWMPYTSCTGNVRWRSRCTTSPETLQEVQHYDDLVYSRYILVLSLQWTGWVLTWTGRRPQSWDVPWADGCSQRCWSRNVRERCVESKTNLFTFFLQWASWILAWGEHFQSDLLSAYCLKSITESSVDDLRAAEGYSRPYFRTSHQIQ